MNNSISKKTAAIIAASLPLVELRRDALEAAMGRYMGRHGPYDPSKGRHQVTTDAIMDMLLDHARRIDPEGYIARVDRHGRRHRELAVGGEHYSCFGDGLGPVFKDVLGAEATPSLLAAWGDAYWAITRISVDGRMALAA